MKRCISGLFFAVAIMAQAPSPSSLRVETSLPSTFVFQPPVVATTNKTPALAAGLSLRRTGTNQLPPEVQRRIQVTGNQPVLK